MFAASAECDLHEAMARAAGCLSLAAHMHHENKPPHQLAGTELECALEARLGSPVRLQVAGVHQLLEDVLIQPYVVQLHDQPVTGGLHSSIEP